MTVALYSSSVLGIFTIAGVDDMIIIGIANANIVSSDDVSSKLRLLIL